MWYTQKLERVKLTYNLYSINTFSTFSARCMRLPLEAQLDKASNHESEGRRFESCRATLSAATVQQPR